MIQRHPVYWFDDADTILYQKASELLYRIHNTRLSSPKFLSDSSSDAYDTLKGSGLLNGEKGLDECRYVVLDPIEAGDFVVLLDHFYGRNVFSVESTLGQVLSILRITSPSQLDIPTLYEQAKKFLVDLCPKDALELARFHCADPEAEEAMALSVLHAIPQCQKPLLYYLATQTHLESSTFPSTIPPTLTSHILQHGHSLSATLIERFTPLLFTPPPTSHMECTDALAEQWMPLVISPAIEDSAMGKPLQTLEKMKNVDWGTYGICESCVKDKLDEWTEEQTAVWDLLDGWILDIKAIDV
ncbi:hypothetical protein GYMLUDRAFT_238964 [Collybiopsis luxurians FD-317 M1]|nr:hypothetical protein GYMLUDRAFT_238964 [Collybiopsis luxurians FD-317 M1]